MNASGDAAEQIVRYSLEGAEFALKVTGAAAKNVAAMLYTVLTDQKRSKGKTRVVSMLREKRPTTIYTVKKEDCPEFARQAKRYGIRYAPIPIKKRDRSVDMMVFADDSARANRIVEKFELTAANTASIQEEIKQSRAVRSGEQPPPEQTAPQKSADDMLLDEMLEKPVQKEKSQPENPAAEKPASFPAAAEKSRPSAPTSESRAKSAKGTSEPQKKSVRKELREIQAARKQESELSQPKEKANLPKKAAQETSQHRQPQKKKKSKSKGR